MEVEKRVEYLLRFLELCQNGFVRPDDNRRNGQVEKPSGNTTGIVRDSKALKDFGIAACRELSELLDFKKSIVEDLSDKNRYEKWD